LVEWPSAAGNVGTLADHRADIKRVTTALAGLGDRERQLIGLRVAGDLTYREIADVLGTSEAAAKVATHRALTKLRGNPSHQDE